MILKYWFIYNKTNGDVFLEREETYGNVINVSTMIYVYYKL